MIESSPVIDLAPQHLATVRSILQTALPTVPAFAFGSRVKNTGLARGARAAKKHSDLDIALKPTHPLGWRALADLREAFEESDLPIRVDVVDWSACSDEFKQHMAGMVAINNIAN